MQAPPEQLVFVAMGPEGSLKQVLLRIYREANQARKLPCAQASRDLTRILECSFSDGYA
jgi:hypothetical protein